LGCREKGAGFSTTHWKQISDWGCLNMKLIYKHDNIAILHSAKNVLALNDIETFVKDEHGSTMSARFGISNMFHELWLTHDQDFEKASTIIENEIENPEPKASWVCVECNEENDGSFDACWNCQNVHASK